MRMVGRICRKDAHARDGGELGPQVAAMISSGGLAARSRGLSRMKMRPVFARALEPLAPIDDMNCSTYGLLADDSATAR